MGFKRKNSTGAADSAANSASFRKKFKTANSTSSACSTPPVFSAADDPYSFDEEEKGNSGNPLPSSAEFSRFFAASAQSGKSKAGGGPGSSSGGSCTGGPVYKFKSALLSRESRTSSTDSRSSGAGSSAGGFSKIVPIAFDRGNGAFGDACDRFIEDLSTKSVSVSRRPSMDAYRERLNALVTKKADRAERKLKKQEAAAAAAAGTEGGTAPDADVTDQSFVVDDEDDEHHEMSVEDVANSSASENLTNNSISSDPASAKSTPTKKKPGRKKKTKTPEKPPEEGEGEAVPSAPVDVACAKGGVDTEGKKQPKKGGLWALPIVPKPPQKPPPPAERRKSPVPPAAKSKDVDLCDVWRQAFGSGGGGGSGGVGGGGEKKAAVKAEVKAEPAEEKVQRRKKTILDVPPETRRRPRPSYGGLIHFAPDWEAKVRKHHERCRHPAKMLATWTCAKPLVLKHGGTSGTVQALSPELSSSLLPPSSTKAALLPAEETAASMSSNSVVDSILEKRKMRKRVHVSKLDKRPPKRKQTAYEKLTEEKIGMIMTPGLPLLTEETSEALMQGANFGNFRRQTLLRYGELCFGNTKPVMVEVYFLRSFIPRRDLVTGHLFTPTARHIICAPQ